MKIIAFTKYPYEGPSSRYRFYNYRACFAEAKIDMRIEPFFSKGYFTAASRSMKLLNVLLSYLRRVFQLFGVLLSPKRCDIVLIEYELLPFFPALFERMLKKRHIRYLVDYDDAIFHKYDLHRNRLVRWLFKKKIAAVMSSAETVIVCNGYLEQYARRYNPNTFRLPTVVLLEKYKEAMASQEKNGGKSRPFVVGWIGSKSTSSYIVDILPALERFAAKYEAKFSLVGFDEAVLPKGMKERCKIEVIPWTEEGEIKEILRFDVGIMPLRSDPWSQGKCGFKLVQYMSCGKPVVASPVGINVSLVEEGRNGFLAGTAEAWFNALEKLCLDGRLREQMAANSLKKVEAEYNHAKNCRKYIDLVNDVVKG